MNSIRVFLFSNERRKVSINVAELSLLFFVKKSKSQRFEWTRSMRISNHKIGPASSMDSIFHVLNMWPDIAFPWMIFCWCCSWSWHCIWHWRVCSSHYLNIFPWKLEPCWYCWIPKHISIDNLISFVDEAFHVVRLSMTEINQREKEHENRKLWHFNFIQLSFEM